MFLPCEIIVTLRFVASFRLVLLSQLLHLPLIRDDPSWSIPVQHQAQYKVSASLQHPLWSNDLSSVVGMCLSQHAHNLKEANVPGRFMALNHDKSDAAQSTTTLFCGLLRTRTWAWLWYQRSLRGFVPLCKVAHAQTSPHVKPSLQFSGFHSFRNHESLASSLVSCLDWWVCGLNSIMWIYAVCSVQVLQLTMDLRIDSLETMVRFSLIWPPFHVFARHVCSGHEVV